MLLLITEKYRSHLSTGRMEFGAGLCFLGLHFLILSAKFLLLFLDCAGCFIPGSGCGRPRGCLRFCLIVYRYDIILLLPPGNGSGPGGLLKVGGRRGRPGQCAARRPGVVIWRNRRKVRILDV
ncbi:hypothetical protein BDW67DRAFT_161053 [Aspergillus spinulosporus]